jgi:hypothetical protein
MWREWLVRLGLWLAQHGGWSEWRVIAPYDAQIQRLASKVDTLGTEILQREETIRRLQARMATVATVSQPVLDRATHLIGDAETHSMGGEAKRHAVYARLIKDFPTVNKRELALAIELALFHAPKEG